MKTFRTYLHSFFLLAAAACGIASLSGCAGYRLGSMLPEDIATVHVPTFVNRTKEPLLEVDTTRATVEEIQKDGSLKVANADSADAVLEVDLIDYVTAPVAYRSDQNTTAKEYRLTIYASVVLKKTTTGEVVARYPSVTGETTFPLIGNLSSAKQSALPRASEDLAHNIIERVVETWQ